MPGYVIGSIACILSFLESETERKECGGVWNKAKSHEKQQRKSSKNTMFLTSTMVFWLTKNCLRALAFRLEGKSEGESEEGAWCTCM